MPQAMQTQDQGTVEPGYGSVGSSPRSRIRSAATWCVSFAGIVRRLSRVPRRWSRALLLDMLIQGTDSQPGRRECRWLG